MGPNRRLDQVTVLEVLSHKGSRVRGIGKAHTLLHSPKEHPVAQALRRGNPRELGSGCPPCREMGRCHQANHFPLDAGKSY
jgi:hypothetical protein